jgi:glycosyltransferase involved in cell wall biosynthesis
MSRFKQTNDLIRAKASTDGAIAATSGVSVVICTFNGGRRLPQCLDALSKCAFENGGEVILVDNNSIDDSAVLATSHWANIKNAPVSLRVVKEVKQGLTWARRTGADVAQYDTIIYCDDDNLLDPDYVTVSMELMRDPEVGAASGIARPVSHATFPSWFYTFAASYAVGYQVRRPEVLGGEDFDMTPFVDRCPWGAGLVVRRQDLLKAFRCPNFPLLLDRNAAALTSGGDYEICHLIALQGRRLVFSPRLRLDHAIPPDRLSLDYFSRLQAGVTGQAKVLKAYAALRGLLKRGPDSLVLGGLRRLIANAIRGRPIGDELFAISVGIDRSILLTDVQRKVLENYQYLRNEDRSQVPRRE